MKSKNKIYWKGLEQLNNDSEFIKHSQNEFSPSPESDTNSRRDFLKKMGFSIATVSLASCEAPVRYAIPYLNKPVDVDPGIPNYYASTYTDGNNYASIVVKTREGRPIKIEPNTLSKLTPGTTPQVEASVLSLYDNQRLRNPLKEGKEIEWITADSEITQKLNKINGTEKKIKIITHSIISPSTQKILNNFITKYPNTSIIKYDAISYSALLDAHLLSFQKRYLPAYHFDKAKTIVSIDADFLGTWINPALFTQQFTSKRKLSSKNKEMNQLFVFETQLSITGGNADYRSAIKPSEKLACIAHIYNFIAKKIASEDFPIINSIPNTENKIINKAVENLWKNKENSLIVCGSNDINAQMLVNAINIMLKNYNNTLDINTPLYLKQGNDKEMINFVADLEAGAIDGLIFYNCNPCYDHPLGEDIAKYISKCSLTISTSDRGDETSKSTQYHLPDSHYLESWNDAEPMKNNFSISQPVIAKIFNTRQAQESFLTWSGETISYRDFIKNYWKENMFTSETEDFQSFWDKCLYNGVFEKNNTEENLQHTETQKPFTFTLFDVSTISKEISKKLSIPNTEYQVFLYENISIGAGEQANNPWLQELPDPISKVCWENYVAMSQKTATDLGISMKEGFTQKISIEINGIPVNLPTVIQPGMPHNTFAIAFGYGRTNGGKVSDGIGFNVFPFLYLGENEYNDANIYNKVSVLNVEKEPYRIAQTQTHQTFMGRETVIQETILDEYQKNQKAGRYEPMITTPEGHKKPGVISLWKGHTYNNHHWGMAIDLNSCTGCSACIIACQSENNIPVVGKTEVINRREMAWLRIDRYYSSDATTDNNNPDFTYTALEKASDNPEVTFQPMMCQHCNNAPCETVCPVAATTHSTEGLNQMAYNRCIGTRYCANNCPYKVRRFNWFKYHDNEQFSTNSSMNNDLGKMVLNPDVTVRSRGVMEKCTMCVQRIQYGKLNAKKENRRPKDGEINTACAASCPSEAIVFGDMKDPDSKISQLLRISSNEKNELEVQEERAYNVLEEINVKPNVWYLTKIRNKNMQIS